MTGTVQMLDEKTIDEYIELKRSADRKLKEIVKCIERHGYIYGYAYGEPFVFGGKDKLIKIPFNCLEFKHGLLHFTWIWGFPLEYNKYYFKDYGITWGLEEEMIKDITPEEWKEHVRTTR